jgi:hypothetical protein
MTTRITTLIPTSTSNLLRLALLVSLVLAAPLVALAQGDPQSSQARAVQIVREATQQFTDVNVARATGYEPAFACVSGPDHGATGIHYVNGTLLGNLTLDPSQPQALIYEPNDGKMTRVGVEFILDSANWLAANNNTPPALDGQVFNLVGAPNRFNIP